MKILHCCLSCFYIDDYNYQENILPIINKEDGHEVMIIASTETFIDNVNLGYVEPREYTTKEGIPIIRLPYKKYLPHKIMRKVRDYEGVYGEIAQFKPDIILFHGMPAYALLEIVKYKRKHPKVKLYVDSHEDFNNSGTNWISLNLLHKNYYKPILEKTFPLIDKVFYLSLETKEFIQKVYGVPETKLEYYPLGGIVVSKEERREIRFRMRQELDLTEEDILLTHSGKLDPLKRTQELLDAFTKMKGKHIHLAVIGSAEEDLLKQMAQLSRDNSNFHYLGWKSGDELMEYLCASDLYVQPGSQSATLQNAVCYGSAVAVYPHPSYINLLGNSAFYVKTQQDIQLMLDQITADREILEEKREKVNTVAREKLDYRMLAKRLYQ